MRQSSLNPESHIPLVTLFKRRWTGAAFHMNTPEYRKISSRPHVKCIDMTGEVCTETMEIITMACDKHVPTKNYEAAAQLIKQSMDKKFGSAWHCFVGEGFVFDINYQRCHMLYLYVGEIGILLYKC